MPSVTRESIHVVEQMRKYNTQMDAVHSWKVGSVHGDIDSIVRVTTESIVTSQHETSTIPSVINQDELDENKSSIWVPETGPMSILEAELAVEVDSFHW